MRTPYTHVESCKNCLIEKKENSKSYFILYLYLKQKVENRNGSYVYDVFFICQQSAGGGGGFSIHFSFQVSTSQQQFKFITSSKSTDCRMSIRFVLVSFVLCFPKCTKFWLLFSVSKNTEICFWILSCVEFKNVGKFKCLTSLMFLGKWKLKMTQIRIHIKFLRFFTYSFCNSSWNLIIWYLMWILCRNLQSK